MPIRLGPIPIEVSLSVRKLIANNPSVYEIVCLSRFTGFDDLCIGKDRTTVSAGQQTVIGKITIAEDVIGHVELIASALATARDNLKRINHDCVFHEDSLSVSVA